MISTFFLLDGIYIAHIIFDNLRIIVHSLEVIMTRDIEDISLKILRILYQFHRIDDKNGLTDLQLFNRFDFVNKIEGEKQIQLALNELSQLKLITNKITGSDNVYSITKKGIKKYEMLKYSVNTDYDQGINVLVQGDWTGNSENHSYHYHINKDESKEFPGDTKEFIQHYKELISSIEDIKNIVIQQENNTGIIDILDHMESILNIDSLGLKQKSPVENRFEVLIDKLEEKLNLKKVEN